MSCRLIASIALMLMLNACGKPLKIDDVFASNQSGSAGYKFECVGGENPDGTCRVKSRCTKVADSDCTLIAKACIDTGNYWEGTREGGTCTRVP